MRRRLARVALALIAAGAIALLVEWRLRLGMPRGRFQLSTPEWLRLLSLAPAIWLAEPFSLVDLSRAQRLLSTGARTLLLALLALALAGPSRTDERQTIATVLLVDASDSVSDRQLDEARRVLDELRAAQGPNELRLVAFARRPTVIPLPLPGVALPSDLAARLRPRSRGELGDATDLQAALELAGGLLPEGRIARVLLLTDGDQTQGDLLAAAGSLRARGARLSIAPYAAEHDDEVLVRELRGPSHVAVGQPFTVEAELFASRPVTARVTLRQGAIENPLDGHRTLRLEAGKNVVKLRSQVAEGGFVRYELRLSDLPPDFHDRFSENDAASCEVAVRGRPRVLFIEGDPKSGTPLAAALRHEQLDVDARGAYGLPSRAADLAPFDLVILSDLPQSVVGLGQLAAVEEWTQGGGGLIVAGGENGFGSGGWGGSALEKMLPVRFDTERKRDQPALALALAIDRSGSMQGEKLELAKEAARASAELLAADDQIAVIAFDSQAQPTVRLQRAANRLRIAADIARLTAGGGTNLLAPLQEAYQELAPARAKIKHVILLTDGQASYEGISELVSEMAQSRITVSAVGVGTGADKTLLAMIAERGGGRFYFTQDAQSVPKIFTKETTEVARSALVEEPLHPRVVKRAELLDGTGIESAPPLRGYVTTRAKPLAEVILASDLGEPLLARWRLGLGQAVVWTSDVKARWAAEWVRWPGFAKLFAQLARATMRHRAGAGESGYQLSTEVDPPRVRVAIDALSEGDRFVSGLDTTLEVTDGRDGKRRFTIPMPQTAPGRYEGEFPLPRYGAFQLRALHRRDGRVVAQTSGTVSAPYPREYLALPPDLALLARAATVGGGMLRPDPSRIWDPGSEKVEERRPLHRLLLAAAALLLVIDVALRRVRLFGWRRQR